MRNQEQFSITLDTNGNKVMTFKGAEIRATPEGHLVAIDVLKALGVKNPRKSWHDMKASRGEELCSKIVTKYSFGGRPPEAVDVDTAKKMGMWAKSKLGEQWRDALIHLHNAYENADEKLTTSLIDRTESKEALKRLAMRAKAKESNKALNSAIVSAGADCFAQVADMNNVAVTGKTAREIQRFNDVKHTRDALTSAELGLIYTSEELEAVAIERRGAVGNGEVLDIAHDVTTDIKALRNKYLGPVRIPSGDDENVPVLQVEI